MRDNPSPTNDTPALPNWQGLDRQFRHFQLLFVAVKAGIPAVLAEGPRTLLEISDALGLPASRLYRVLRGLVWCEALDVDTDGAYGLTAAGKTLLDDAPHSLAANLRFQGEFFFNTWGHLWDYLATGETPFRRAHAGASLFDLLEADSELAAVFGAPMTARSAEHSEKIAAHPAIVALDNRDSVTSPLIVDVGGGEGRLLMDILKAHPKVHGLVLEMPVLEAAATRLIAEEGLSERCGFVPGDMFAEVPAKGDVYILKWVLHDWNDEDAVRILQRCADAMRPSTDGASDARLLIVERLMPDVVDSAHTGLVQADLNMLCQMGGAERTRAEYEALLARTDLQLLSVVPIDDVWGFVALECQLRTA